MLALLSAAAAGVNCTALVSPVDVDLRRQDFMWEATAWHEYTHVLTLGVSNNRVPRWLTEGFSVYEERARDTSWERGMDRELFDAFYNRDIPPVRLMNRLFRGPRILFGYYQGGLIVELVTKRYGFDKASTARTPLPQGVRSALGARHHRYIYSK